MELNFIILSYTSISFQGRRVDAQTNVILNLSLLIGEVTNINLIDFGLTDRRLNSRAECTAKEVKIFGK